MVVHNVSLTGDLGGDTLGRFQYRNKRQQVDLTSVRGVGGGASVDDVEPTGTRTKDDRNSDEVGRTVRCPSSFRSSG